MSTWTPVAKLTDLSESTGKMVEIDGLEIALFKEGATVYALDNECPHRQGPISEGELNDGIVTCPWHAWDINAMTGEVVYNPRLKSKTYPCKIMDGVIYLEVPDGEREGKGGVETDNEFKTTIQSE
jgi:nitrite reductase/ring-hydroxylating ferredoxin subunit